MSITKQGNREKLMSGALICLRDKGYAATTARDIVAASGANLASIGYHYGSKEALLNAAVAEAARMWTRSVEAETFAQGDGSAAEHLERSLAAIVDRFGELEPYLRSFVEAFPPAIRSQELRATMAESYEDVRSAGTEMITRFVEQAGGEPDPATARTLASVLVALGDGLILQWLLDPDATPRSSDIAHALGALANALGRGA